MISLPQLATYVSYFFVIVAYTIKVVKIARMPMHLRWELYPVVHEKEYRYGGSYFEEPEWWTRPRRKYLLRSIVLKLRDYLVFPGYFQRKKGYWFGLYPWHMGFYLIISFHIVTFFSALAMVTAGISISAGSASAAGQISYYLALVIGAGSFILGTVGSIIMLGKRLLDRELRAYAVPANFFNYLFFLTVFLSGLVAWLFFDPTLAAYREFWKSLITFRYAAVEPAIFAHIMLFSLFLIYLPFTRSTHYITKFFSFFSVLWDDRPNLKGKEFQTELHHLLDKKVGWAAPHIQSGKSWREVASGLPDKSEQKQ